MKLRAIILDFDGTLVTEDITDILCDLAGKKDESAELNRLFHEGKLNGLEGLARRINFLKGISLEQIRQVVEKNNYLREGAHELFDFLKQHHIISIIASGSIPHDAVAAIGDSPAPADKGLFALAAVSIAINPKVGIEQFANYVIRDDLAKAIPVLRRVQLGGD